MSSSDFYVLLLFGAVPLILFFLSFVSGLLLGD